MTAFNPSSRFSRLILHVGYLGRENLLENGRAREGKTKERDGAAVNQILRDPRRGTKEKRAFLLSLSFTSFVRSPR